MIGTPSSSLLTLLVLPILYRLAHRPDEEDEMSAEPSHPPDVFQACGWKRPCLSDCTVPLQPQANCRETLQLILALSVSISAQPSLRTITVTTQCGVSKVIIK